MTQDPGTSELLILPAEQIELTLARIETSAAFARSPRHRALLRYLVAQARAGDHAVLKETVIAVEVFGRRAASFDPKLDTIVRVEARRLRARLSRYYRSEGHDALIRIELPVGGYVPLVAGPAARPHAAYATRRARDLVERGEHFLRQPLSRQTLEQARRRFEQALLDSPNYAAAFVGLGRVWFNLGSAWHIEPATASAHAAKVLRHALALDPENAVAHTLLAAVQHQFEHDWPRAQRGFKRALALAPHDAFVHSAYGYHLGMHGEHAQAERELTMARRLDPQYINTRVHMVNVRIQQGRLDDAEAEVLAIQDIAPETIAIVGLRAAIAMYRGDALTALALYQSLCQAHPDVPGVFVAQAAALALAGRVDEADSLVAHTLRRFTGRPISPYLQAIFATRRGHTDLAFELLERAYEERDPYVPQIPQEPSFDALHADPRWRILLARKPFARNWSAPAGGPQK